MILPTNRIRETSAASYAPKAEHHSNHSRKRSEHYETRVAYQNTRPVVEMNPGADQSSTDPGITAQTGLGG